MSGPNPRGLELLAGVPDIPSHEAQRLLLAAAAITSDQLYAGRRIAPQEQAGFAAMVERRRAHAHVLAGRLQSERQ